MTGDENIMRREHRTLSDDEKVQMEQIKDLGKAFFDRCTLIGNSREMSLAKTRIEEAVMWAVKHITR